MRVWYTRKPSDIVSKVANPEGDGVFFLVMLLVESKKHHLNWLILEVKTFKVFPSDRLTGKQSLKMAKLVINQLTLLAFCVLVIFGWRLASGGEPGNSLKYNSTTGAIDAGSPGPGELGLVNATLETETTAGELGLVRLTGLETVPGV